MINFEDFTKLDFRVGTILEVYDFPEAHKPAYKLKIDFGPIGIKYSSAQITTLYSKDQLQGRQIIAVVNFPEKKIANFKSQCLVLGIEKEKDVILLTTQMKVPNGSVVC